MRRSILILCGLAVLSGCTSREEKLAQARSDRAVATISVMRFERLLRESNHPNIEHLDSLEYWDVQKARADAEVRRLLR